MNSFSESDVVRQLNELDSGGQSAWNTYFMQLKNATLEGTGERSFRVAVSNLNRFKNRYQDVIPFDQARVVLSKENMYPAYEKPVDLIAKAESSLCSNSDSASEQDSAEATATARQLFERAKFFSDYVNASPVACPPARREYILTQGPVASTTPDFWEMIWEQRCSVIVMLNNLVEKGMSKCYPYYPTLEHKGQRLHYLSDSRVYVIPAVESSGPADDQPLAEFFLPDLSLRVQLMSETVHSSYTLRRLRLLHLPHSFLSSIPLWSSATDETASNQLLADLLADAQWKSSAEVREVHHFHYRVWADFSVPDVPSFLNLLLAVRRTRVFENGSSIAMHCSAGIGRSGTFALVDSALHIVEQQRTLDAVDMRRLLLTLRTYRMGLVQTPDQLRFCYTSVIEGGRLILSALESADPATPVDEVVNALDCEALLREPPQPSATDENNHSPPASLTPRSTHSDDEKLPRRPKSRPEPPPVPSRSSLGNAPASTAPSPPPRSSPPATSPSHEPVDDSSISTARRRTTGEEHDSRQEREERIRQKMESMRRKQQEMMHRTGPFWALRRYGLAFVELSQHVLPAPLSLSRPRSSTALIVGSLTVLVLAVGIWYYLQ